MHHGARTGRVALAAAAMLIAAGLGIKAMEEPQSAPPADEPKQDGPRATKPSPQHTALARSEGVWDARVEIAMGAPGTPPMISKGVETSRLCCGGLWLVTEFKSEPGSPPFEGHGITGYEPGKKKYSSTWVDSDLTTPMVSEGTYDPSGRTLTKRGSMTSSGKTMTWRDVTEWKDDDTRQYTLFRRGPDGKEAASLSITYTRRK